MSQFVLPANYVSWMRRVLRCDSYSAHFGTVDPALFHQAMCGLWTIIPPDAKQYFQECDTTLAAHLLQNNPAWAALILGSIYIPPPPLVGADTIADYGQHIPFLPDQATAGEDDPPPYSAAPGQCDQAAFQYDAAAVQEMLQATQQAAYPVAGDALPELYGDVSYIPHDNFQDASAGLPVAAPRPVHAQHPRDILEEEPAPHYTLELPGASPTSFSLPAGPSYLETGSLLLTPFEPAPAASPSSAYDSSSAASSSSAYDSPSSSAPSTPSAATPGSDAEEDPYTPASFSGQFVSYSPGCDWSAALGPYGKMNDGLPGLADGVLSTGFGNDYESGATGTWGY